MSRIGKLPVEIPQGVSVEIAGGEVKASGSKGNLAIRLPSGIDAKIEDGKLFISSAASTKSANALYGTYRALLANMITGVDKGWKVELELSGTGYRAEVQGNSLILTVGFSHPVKVEAPAGVVIRQEKNVIIIEGADKEVVGQLAAKIRRVRPPEPYKGKGILYKGEKIRRKAGKAAKAQGAAA